MRYLGIDFGLRRAGLAVSEGDIASPWKVIEASSTRKLAERIYQEILENNFDKIIIGKPEGKMGKAVLRFIKFLSSKGLDVKEVDETLSTRRASEVMLQLGVPKMKRRINDSYSAAIILQNFLDEL